ncbi:hypothetical protein [Candidatus Uabimicrobium sp. HlEnr_7]|uniref:hypothetical protein n=1 Tax=Candidatus Uabimicrobium helgolandensis TaxID=3095367 RepID=UPI003556654E
MKFIGFIPAVFITVFIYLVTIIYDERWQKAYEFFDQNDHSLPFIFKIVLFFQSFFWIIAPVLLLFCLVRMEIQNPLRNILLCVLFFMIIAVLQRALEETGVFLDPKKSLSFTPVMVLGLILLYIGGLGYTTEKIWEFSQIPEALVSKWEKSVDKRHFPSLSLAVKWPYVVALFIAILIFDSDKRQVTPENFKIKRLTVKEHNLKNQQPRRKDFFERFLLTTSHITSLKNIESNLFCDLNINIKWQQLEQKQMKIDLLFELNGYKTLTDHIYKQQNLNLSFTSTVRFPDTYAIEHGEYLYLNALNQLQEKVRFFPTKKHSFMRQFFQVKTPIKAFFSTEEAFFIDTNDQLLIFNNAFKEYQSTKGTSFFENSTFTTDFVIVSNKQLLHNKNLKYTIEGKIHKIAMSRLGATTLAQIDGSLFRLQHDWIWEAQEIDFPAVIKKIVFNYDGRRAFLLTKNNELFVCNLHNFSIENLGQFPFTVNNMKLGRDGRIFLATNLAGVVAYDLDKNTLNTICAPKETIFDLGISIDGRYLISGGQSKIIRILDLNSQTVYDEVTVEDVITHVSFTPFSDCDFIVALQNGEIMVSIGK